MKGGGDATSAARAVLRDPASTTTRGTCRSSGRCCSRWSPAGKGQLLIGAGGGVEQIYCNQTDPNKTVDGERSSLKAPHPFLTDLKVRQALALALDRQTIAAAAVRAGGQRDRERADDADQPRVEEHEDGVRHRDGQPAARRGRVPARAGRHSPEGRRPARRWCSRPASTACGRRSRRSSRRAGPSSGSSTTLKSVDAGVFFSSSPGNNDTVGHFYTDVEMYTDTFGSPFPASYMAQWYAKDPAQDGGAEGEQLGGDRQLPVDRQAVQRLVRSGAGRARPQEEPRPLDQDERPGRSTRRCRCRSSTARSSRAT